jgi:hypothetical protein
LYSNILFETDTLKNRLWAFLTATYANDNKKTDPTDLKHGHTLFFNPLTLINFMAADGLHGRLLQISNVLINVSINDSFKFVSLFITLIVSVAY